MRASTNTSIQGRLMRFSVELPQAMLTSMPCETATGKNAEGSGVTWASTTPLEW
jgi:hypothetical protein